MFHFSTKTKIILSIIIVIGTIFFTIKAKNESQSEQEKAFSSVEQKPVIEMDTVSVMINYTIKPYTQKYARTAINRFDLAVNNGEVTRSFSTSFNDTTGSVTVTDTTLPDRSRGEHSSFVLNEKTISQDFMFRTANDAPNTYKNVINVVYLEGDSASAKARIELKPRGIETIKKTYLNQLRVQSEALAHNLIYQYLDAANLPPQRVVLTTEIPVKTLPPTDITVAHDTLYYTTKGETIFHYIFSAEVPKL